MPSTNKIIICAAGGGKTTRIVKDACYQTGKRCALITFTRNNEQEIHRKFYENSAALPTHIEIMTWFSFLLHEMARPYRSVLHPGRIEGLCWVDGRSAIGSSALNVSRHYFQDGRRIYSDKIAKFVCECNRRTQGKVMRRLAQRFQQVFIDEVQDLAGDDLEILELMLNSGIEVCLVGDHRQATYITNNAKKNSKVRGKNIIERFREWEERGLASIIYDCHTHRCHQEIANLGDSLYPSEPRTKSLSCAVTEHDGIFHIPAKSVAAYIARFSPQILRYDRKTLCDGYSAMNFGESKGLTFDRVLIFPNVSGSEWLRTGQVKKIESQSPECM